jgi:type I pantothenate kinase
MIRKPEILIVEGLNVLQASTKGSSPTLGEVSDYLDVSIYVDAAETDVALWFTERLSAMRSEGAAPGSFLHGLASLSESEFTALAAQVWEEVNLVNLRENVVPTRGRAHLIVEKGHNHRVDRMLLRRS